MLRPEVTTVVSEAILLDVDRCALDTSSALDLAAKTTAMHTPITYDQLMQAYDDTKREGRSFNVVGYVNHTLGETPYSWEETVEANFIEEGRRRNLLMKDAHKIIDYARQSDIHLGLYTYGASSPDRGDQKWRDAKRWQLAKVAAAAELADLPCYVTNNRQKGSEISSWYRSREGFYLPRELTVIEGGQTIAHSLVLIDDKTESFADISKGADGIRVTPPDQANRLGYQKGILREGIVAVNGMTEALGALKALRAQRVRLEPEY